MTHCGRVWRLACRKDEVWHCLGAPNQPNQRLHHPAIGHHRMAVRRIAQRPTGNGAKLFNCPQKHASAVKWPEYERAGNFIDHHPVWRDEKLNRQNPDIIQRINDFCGHVMGLPCLVLRQIGRNGGVAQNVVFMAVFYRFVNRLSILAARATITETSRAKAISPSRMAASACKRVKMAPARSPVQSAIALCRHSRNGGFSNAMPALMCACGAQISQTVNRETVRRRNPARPESAFRPACPAIRPKQQAAAQPALHWRACHAVTWYILKLVSNNIYFTAKAANFALSS